MTQQLVDQISRTPVCTKFYGVAVRVEQYKRTPVVDGEPQKPLDELVWNPQTSAASLDQSLKLSAVAPELEPLWLQTNENLMATSCAYFAAEMISGPPEPPYDGKFLVGWHHEEWDQLINENDRILVEASRDSGKSYMISMVYPIWKAGYKSPGSLGYIFSATQTLAESLMSMVKQELLTNRRFEHLLPTSRDREWSKKEIHLSNGSVIRARGMGVKIRGGHPQWIVVDDGLSDDDIYSETLRNRNIDYYLSAIVNMIVPGGQICVFGTPFHQYDLYGYLKKTGEYVCRKYPAIFPDGRLLFPERYDRKRLEARQRELGPARFAREFKCVALSDEMSLFPSTLFEGDDIRQQYTLGLPAQYWHERGMKLFCGIDFAMSSSAQADYTVIFTAAVDEHGNRWIADIRRGKGWGFQRQLDEIKEEYQLMQFEIAHAEANQMQRIFADELIRSTDIPIRKFFTSGVQPTKPWRQGMGSITAGKHNLEKGIPSLRIQLENRKWRIPRGDQHSIELTDLWMGELQCLSWQNGNVVSVGGHDDMATASWICDSAIKLGAFSFSFGEEPTEYHDRTRQLLDNSETCDYDTRGKTEDWRQVGGAPRASDLGFGSGFEY